MMTRTISRVTMGAAALAISAALVVGVVGASSASAAKPAKGTATVSIANYLYMPKTLTIAAGTKVTWTNKDATGHTVTFSSFGSKILAPGKAYSHKFATAGTFKYHCTLHPEMTAKVVVTG